MSERKKVLSVISLSKHFGGLRAVDDVSFDLMDGDILGLLGPNGAGKTTCFNMISGVYSPTAGKVFFEGARTDGMQPHEMAAKGVGRTFQIVRPFSNLTVLENIIIALGMEYYPSFFASLSRWFTQKSRSRAMEILERLGLENYAYRKAGQLPLGDLRRLEIGRVLALKPHLLLLDESFSGLRHEQIDRMEELILSLVKQGISILLIEHNMKVAMKLCNRIVVLNHGIKLAEGSPAEISANPEVVEAYLGKGGRIHVASSR